jgi:hypothetical protein
MLGEQLRKLHYRLGVYLEDDGTVSRASLEEEIQRFSQQVNADLEARANDRLGQIRNRIRLALARASSQLQDVEKMPDHPREASAVFFPQTPNIALPPIQLNLQQVIFKGIQDVLPVGVTISAGVGGAVGGAKVAALVSGAKAGTALGVAAGPVGAVIGGIVAGAAGLMLGDRARSIVRQRWERKLTERLRRRLLRGMKEQLSKLHRRSNLQIVTQIDRVRSELDEQLRRCLAIP